MAKTKATEPTTPNALLASVAAPFFAPPEALVPVSVPDGALAVVDVATIITSALLITISTLQR